MTTQTRAWPDLPLEEWAATKATVHRFTQIVGKVRMALVSPRNHWWHVTLYPSVRGLSTGMMFSVGRPLEIRFDFVDHTLEIVTVDAGTRRFALRDGLSCASFYEALFAGLDEVGVQVEIQARPFDLGDSPPFAEDTQHCAYDPGAVERWWRILQVVDLTLPRFASRFNGKTSPTQLFWHTFDLAQARFSGRPAPAIDGADAVTAEAYSHEVIAFGWWPGDERQTPYPAFYSYTAPEPPGLGDHALRPSAASWQDTGNGSLALLPYADVRLSDDPQETLLAFFQSAYEAGATTAGWDLAATDTGRR